MNLFEEKNRTDKAYANHLDNTYDFFDRSALSWIELIRNHLNNWFDKYPKSEKVELKARFKDKFSPAFYELFIHEYFSNQGFTLEPHPKINGTTKRPDFLVKGKGIEFYLEAKEAMDKSDKEVSLENKEKLFYDGLNKVNSPNFFLKLDKVEFKLSNQPSSKKLVRFLENKLPNYNPDLLAKKVKEKGFDELEKIIYEDKNLKVQVSLIPKSPKIRGKKDIRPIGIYPINASWGGAGNSLKSAFTKKATRYGKLDKPFIICINSKSDKPLDDYEVLNAMFGSSTYFFNKNKPITDGEWSRKFDGIFQNTLGAKYTRVSAVFITDVYPANLHIAREWFIQHPYSNKPINFDYFEASKIYVEETEIKSIVGKTIKEILNIPDNWMNRME